MQIVVFKRLSYFKQRLEQSLSYDIVIVLDIFDVEIDLIYTFFE